MNAEIRMIKTSCLTSEPGGAVGLGWRRVYTEALASQHVAVLRFLHQEADLSQQPVEETRQHWGAANHHQVLGQHLPSINGALQTHVPKHTINTTKTTINISETCHYQQCTGLFCCKISVHYQSRMSKLNTLYTPRLILKQSMDFRTAARPTEIN